MSQTPNLGMVVDPELHAALVAERERASERLRALDDDMVAIVQGAVDANGDDEHDPEGATVAFERQRTAALKAHAEARLREVQSALAALHAGTYGICRNCGERIAGERLVALPGAHLCVGCASRPSGLPPFTSEVPRQLV